MRAGKVKRDEISFPVVTQNIHHLGQNLECTQQQGARETGA